MLSRRVWSRATPVIVLVMIIRLFLRCLLNDMTVRSVALAQLHHSHHKQTPLFLLFLSG